MRILLASSEVHPYSKTGGLGDMVGALGKALAQAGHQVGVVTPLYQGIVERFPQIKRVDWHLDLPLGTRRAQAELWTVELPAGHTVYFIHKPDFFYRPSLYQKMARTFPTMPSVSFSFPRPWRIWPATCLGGLKSCMPTTGKPASCRS